MPLLQTRLTETSDFPASATNAPLLATGQSLVGRIGQGGDADFVAVTLAAGGTYTFAVAGTGTDRLPDPVLRLYGSDGSTLLAQSSDGLRNSGAAIVYEAKGAGTVYLSVTDAAANRTGQYELSAAAGTTPHLSFDMAVAMIDSNASWSAARGSATALSVSFMQHGHMTAEAALASGSRQGLWNFTEAQKAMTFAAFDMLDDLVNVTFTFLDGYSTAGDIRLQNYAVPDGNGGYAYYPADRSSASAGDIFIHNATTGGVETTGYAYELLIHELGHAMGLSHPESYDEAGAIQLAEDNNAWSAMSYSGRSEAGFSDLDEQTFMLADIAALQLKYGANMATRAGDTTYGIGGEAGTIYDFTTNHAPALAIWDGGGNDTLSGADLLSDQRIDLNEGAFSDMAGYVGNISIAYGAIIEAAIGGHGDDLLRGNAVSNRIEGRNGADTLDGGAGDDTLVGGQGADLIEGGSGRDLLFASGVAGVPAVETASADTAEAFGLVVTSKAAGSSLRLADTALSGADGSFSVEFLWQAAGEASTSYNIRIGNLYFAHPDNGRLVAWFDGGDRPDVWNHSPPVGDALRDGQVHRVSMTFDAASGVFCFYLDGRLLSSDSATDRMMPDRGSIRIDDNAGFGDLRIWDRALTGDEVAANAAWRLTGAEDGLLGNWVGNGSGRLVSTDGGADFTAAGQTSAITARFWDNVTADTLSGGAGDDIYHVDSTDDTVIEAVDGGTDVIFTTASFRLAEDVLVEQLRAVSDAGLALTGNTSANLLVGAAGRDSLTGGGGSDSLSGAGGRDILSSSSGNDLLTGGAAADTLSGAAGNDTIAGGGGSDLVSGGGGRDVLTGGGGSDVFAFATGCGRDRIMDFGGTDTLRIASDLWRATGAATIKDFLETRADQQSGYVELRFTGDDVLRLDKVTVAMLAEWQDNILIG